MPLSFPPSTLISFLMAGDAENDDIMLQYLHALAANGAGVIELGMPFSDPMADGPAIQRAGLRSLARGTTLSSILNLVRAFRRTNTHTPIVLMGYFNPILHYGTEAFCRDAAAAGVHGLIVVDLPPEEDALLYTHASAHGLAWIRLVTPTTDAARLAVILKRASGFLYYVSVAGVTGTKSANLALAREKLAMIRAHSTLPLAVGFGIKTPQQAREFSSLADAVVVGSAFVERIEKGASAEELGAFARQLHDAIVKKD